MTVLAFILFLLAAVPFLLGALKVPETVLAWVPLGLLVFTVAFIVMFTVHGKPI